jgi:RNA polymerase sigma-70 factor, ECF subfamily
MSSSFQAARFPAVPLSREKDRAAPIYYKDSAEPSDEALIGEICAGNQEALAILFRRYARLVWAVSERIVRNRAEADDLLQDVFLLLGRKAHVFDPTKGSVRSLIIHVAYQQALTRRRYLNSRSCPSDEAIDRTAKIPAPPVRLYDESIEAHFGRDRTREALEGLSVDQRRTLELFFRDGYTLSEIAELLGQSAGQAKHHYYRGLQGLRKRLLGCTNPEDVAKR